MFCLSPHPPQRRIRKGLNLLSQHGLEHGPRRGVNAFRGHQEAAVVRCIWRYAGQHCGQATVVKQHQSHYSRGIGIGNGTGSDERRNCRFWSAVSCRAGFTAPGNGTWSDERRSLRFCPALSCRRAGSKFIAPGNWFRLWLFHFRLDPVQFAFSREPEQLLGIYLDPEQPFVLVLGREQAQALACLLYTSRCV